MVDGGFNDLPFVEIRVLEVQGYVSLDGTKEEDVVGFLDELDCCIIGCRPAKKTGEERVVFNSEGFAVEGESDWDAVGFRELCELFGEVAAGCCRPWPESPCRTTHHCLGPSFIRPCTLSAHTASLRGIVNQCLMV